MDRITVDDLERILDKGTDAKKGYFYHRIASSSTKQLARLIHERNGDGWYALHVAAYSADLRFFRLLVEKGANHDVLTGSDETVLMFAAAYSYEILEYMFQELECGFEFVNAYADNYSTALHRAVDSWTAPKSVELLLTHGADPASGDDQQRTPLLLAAEYGDTESAKLLVEYGHHYYDDGDGWNAMHYAVDSGHAAFVQWLIDIEVDDNEAEAIMLHTESNEGTGKTPLDLAIARDDQDVIAVLIQGFKSNISLRKGHLCLHWIFRELAYESSGIVLPVGTLDEAHMLALLTLFVSGQSNLLTTTDETGALPLHIACQNSDTPIALIQFLVEHGPTTMHCRNNQGNLPIHILCGTARPPLDTIKYLHSKHATSVTMKNYQGCSPFVVASTGRASLDVVFYLMKINPAAALASFRF